MKLVVNGMLTCLLPANMKASLESIVMSSSKLLPPVFLKKMEALSGSRT